MPAPLELVPPERPAEAWVETGGGVGGGPMGRRLAGVRLSLAAGGRRCDPGIRRVSGVADRPRPRDRLYGPRGAYRTRLLIYPRFRGHDGRGSNPLPHGEDRPS